MNYQLVYLELEKVLKLKGYSLNTIESYVNHTRRFIDYYESDLKLVSSEDVIYLLEENKCSASYVNISISAIKFMVNNVLRRTDINIDMFRLKKEKKLPDILSKKK